MVTSKFQTLFEKFLGVLMFKMATFWVGLVSYFYHNKYLNSWKPLKVTKFRLKKSSLAQTTDFLPFLFYTWMWPKQISLFKGVSRNVLLNTAKTKKEKLPWPHLSHITISLGASEYSSWHIVQTISPLSVAPKER